MSVVVLVLDSLRYDVAEEALPPQIRALGPLERRWSYASWTLPSHVCLASGLLPHRNDGRPASSVYRESYDWWREALGLPEDALQRFASSLWLPTWCRQNGIRPQAVTSLPCIGRVSPLSRAWSVFHEAPVHNDLDAATRMLDLHGWHLTLINTGETHYPYAPAGVTRDLPRVSGVRGAATGATSSGLTGADTGRLRKMQAEACASVGPAFDRLMARLAPGTRVVVTSDHGELFGEGGCFGHGPYYDPALFQVPFLEGTR